MQQKYIAIVGPVYPGQVLQLELCTVAKLCDDNISSLYVETFL